MTLNAENNSFLSLCCLVQVYPRVLRVCVHLLHCSNEIARTCCKQVEQKEIVERVFWQMNQYSFSRVLHGHTVNAAPVLYTVVYLKYWGLGQKPGGFKEDAPLPCSSGFYGYKQHLSEPQNHISVTMNWIRTHVYFDEFSTRIVILLRPSIS